MAKGQKRSTREIRKPKQEKKPASAPTPAFSFPSAKGPKK